MKGLSGKKRTAAISLCVILLGAALFAVGWIGYSICLQNNWRGDLSRLGKSFDRARENAAACVVSYRNTEAAADRSVLDFFYDAVAREGCKAYKHAASLDTARAVRLATPDGNVYFAPSGDGELLHVQWMDGGRQRSYLVQGGESFRRIAAYYYSVLLRVAMSGPTAE